MSDRQHRIPIRNIYYILCYAWDILQAKELVRAGGEEFQDIYDLLSRVFDMALHKLIRSGFVRSYITKTETVSAVKGKIQIQESIKLFFPKTKKIVCSYDEYSADTAFNQIINYTIEKLIKNKQVARSVVKNLKEIRPFFAGIGQLPPTKINCQKLVYSRNTAQYRLLINISIMLYQSMIFNETDGSYSFSDYLDNDQMGRVFQSFLRNFYYSHLDRKKYKVRAENIDWHYEESDGSVWLDLFDVDKDLGNRQTDISIDIKELNLQLILEAKFYRDTFVNARMKDDERRIRTQHLNQIRGYIEDSAFTGSKIGALIYPMTTSDLSKGSLKPVKGANIIVKTVNLDDEWNNIEEDLLGFVKKIEAGFLRIQDNEYSGL